MAEHKVRKNNVIYIIPTDELYEKLKNGEAFIDDYGRLMNRKPHRVLKELKHYADNTPKTQQKSSAPAPTPVRKGSSIGDQIKDSVRDNLADAAGEVVGRTVEYGLNKLFYEGLPYVWHNGIVPLYHRAKDALTSKGTKAETVLRQERANTEIKTVKPAANTKMTLEEADAEKRKVLYHWLGMLSSLKKLHDAGEIDIDSTLAQLTDPAMLNRVNGFLSENPNLLEMDKYITLHDLLGRDLYKEGQLIPIEATEIETIAETYGKAEKDSTEDNKDGRK